MTCFFAIPPTTKLPTSRSASAVFVSLTLHLNTGSFIIHIPIVSAFFPPWLWRWCLLPPNHSTRIPFSGYENPPADCVFPDFPPRWPSFPEVLFIDFQGLFLLLFSLFLRFKSSRVYLVAKLFLSVFLHLIFPLGPSIVRPSDKPQSCFFAALMRNPLPWCRPTLKISSPPFFTSFPSEEFPWKPHLLHCTGPFANDCRPSDQPQKSRDLIQCPE